MTFADSTRFHGFKVRSLASSRGPSGCGSRAPAWPSGVVLPDPPVRHGAPRRTSSGAPERIHFQDLRGRGCPDCSLLGLEPRRPRVPWPKPAPQGPPRERKPRPKEFLSTYCVARALLPRPAPSVQPVGDSLIRNWLLLACTPLAIL